MSFGHESRTISIDGLPVHMDTWGAGPFMFRIDGKRYFFEDSDMFGPSVVGKRTWNPTSWQPGERHRFWDAYGMWRKAGRPTRGTGKVKVAVWMEPQKGMYWIDDRGVSHFLRDPDLEHIGYIRVPNPNP